MGITSLQQQFAAQQFAALTVAGNTASVGPMDFVPTEHSVEVVTTGAPATATVQLEGSLDGVNFFPVGTAQAMAAGGLFSVTGVPLRYAQVSLTALTGGTSPTVTCSYLGVRA